jgi:BolA protein
MLRPTPRQPPHRSMHDPGMIDEIRGRIESGLAPAEVSIEDESGLHAGHPGAKGGGHFRVRVVSPRFGGRSPIARHRLVYDLLLDLMHTRIHALSITALTPEEKA